MTAALHIHQLNKHFANGKTRARRRGDKAVLARPHQRNGATDARRCARYQCHLVLQHERPLVRSKRLQPDATDHFSFCARNASAP